MSPVVLSIKSDEADRLARELAVRTGESITEAVTTALRERLDRSNRTDGVAERLMSITALARDLPQYDQRSADDILVYDEDGLPM
jgi:antitoxin VapB